MDIENVIADKILLQQELLLNALIWNVPCAGIPITKIKSSRDTLVRLPIHRKVIFILKRYPAGDNL